jgi:hypothetical protein
LLKKIDFFKNTKSQFGVLDSFKKSLQKALRRQSIDSKTYNHLVQTPGNILAGLAKNTPDCTAGFNAIMPPNSFWEPLKIPHLSIVVDSACYYPNLLHCKNSIIAFAEEDSCIFFQMLGKKEVFLLPHAIDKKWLEPFENKKRDLDIVMCGTFYDPEECRRAWKEHISNEAQEKMEIMAQKVLASPSLSHLEIFSQEVAEDSVFAKELEMQGTSLFGLMGSLEHYLRAVDRIEFIKAIDKFAVHIFGPKEDEAAWKSVLPSKNNIYFHEAVSYDELPSLFRRARCVLSSIPTIKRGLHERLLLALSQGASVLTNENIFIPKVFPQKNAVINVLSPHYRAANALLAEVFRDEEARLQEVLSLSQTTLKKHTFDARVELLQEVLPEMLQEIARNW